MISHLGLFDFLTLTRNDLIQTIKSPLNRYHWGSAILAADRVISFLGWGRLGQLPSKKDFQAVISVLRWTLKDFNPPGVTLEEFDFERRSLVKAIGDLETLVLLIGGDVPEEK